MFYKLLGYWCIAFSFSGAESQVLNSFNSGYDSRFSKSWNLNDDFSIRDNKPFITNTVNPGSNFFSSNARPNENKFSPPESEKPFKWGYETARNIGKTSDWNSSKLSNEITDIQPNAFNNRRNEKKFNSIMNLPSSSQWIANSSSFTPNSDFSSYGYNSVKPSSDQSNRRPESWNSNNINKHRPNGNNIFSESDDEINSVYSSWSLSNNKKAKTTSNPNGTSNNESTTQKSIKNFGNLKWESSKNKKLPGFNTWEMNNTSSQSGKEHISNLSASHTSVLDELDKNEWYFGKESNYPKPPFRSTLNIDVSELWNFDKNNKNRQRSGNGNVKINNSISRRNRQIKRLNEKMVTIHCECVNVDLCDDEDKIYTQESFEFEVRPFEKYYKCKQVTDVCCTNPKIKVNSRVNLNDEKRQLKCGQRRAEENQFESFGDRIAKPWEFPWYLRLEKAEINCSASLIHPKMALTAAHCVTSAQPEELILKAGLWNLNGEPTQNRRVAKIIQHSGYNSRNPRNDIALLVLETPFELSDNVNIICLPQTNDKWDSNHCVVAGWRPGVTRGEDSELLEKEDVNLLPQTECQSIMLITDLWRNYILHDSFICGVGKSKRESCLANEGGFIICPSEVRPGTYLQIGVVSKGINCDNYGRPGIFTNILKFLDWINKNFLEQVLFD